MINIKVENQNDLWLELAYKFLGGEKGLIDYSKSRSRPISLGNRMEIRKWNSDWDGSDLLRVVGYESEGGTKLTSLFNTYVNKEEFDNLVQAVKDDPVKNRFTSLGMNFNMKVRGKGGCLSSFHVIKQEKQYEVFVYAKIVEVPKKFLADLKLITLLIKNLGLPKTLKVTICTSVLFYSMVTVRSYETIFGREMEHDHLPMPLHYDFGEYQRQTVRRIANYKRILTERYGKEKMEKGIITYLNEKGLFI